MTTPALQALEDDLEDLGYKPGTPEYDRALRARKVEHCRDTRGVGSCSVCEAFEHCGLIKEHLMDLKYPNRRQ